MDVELQKFTNNGSAVLKSNGGIVGNETSMETEETECQNYKTGVEKAQTDLESDWNRTWRVMKARIKVSLMIFLGVVYFGYFFYAMYCKLGDEGSIRLLVCTVFGVLYLFTVFLTKYEKVSKWYRSVVSRISKICSSGKTIKIIRWYV